MIYFYRSDEGVGNLELQIKRGLSSKEFKQEGWNHDNSSLYMDGFFCGNENLFSTILDNIDIIKL